jgi:hypothetical protein
MGMNKSVASKKSETKQTSTLQVVMKKEKKMYDDFLAI